MERALKFARVDHEALRQRLESLEAEKQGASRLEDNWIFDSDGALEGSDSLLRLRLDRQGSRLTFKGPASFEGRIKVREEHETTVGDLDQMRAILEALGYRPLHRYQKYREEWLLGSVVIALDHTPLGDFVELEGEGCETVAKRCGFDPEEAERRSYLRLWADHRKAHPEASESMIFRR